MTDYTELLRQARMEATARGEVFNGILPMLEAAPSTALVVYTPPTIRDRTSRLLQSVASALAPVALGVARASVSVGGALLSGLRSAVTLLVVCLLAVAGRLLYLPMILGIGGAMVFLAIHLLLTQLMHIDGSSSLRTAMLYGAIGLAAATLRWAFSRARLAVVRGQGAHLAAMPA